MSKCVSIGTTLEVMIFFLEIGQIVVVKFDMTAMVRTGHNRLSSEEVYNDRIAQ